MRFLIAAIGIIAALGFWVASAYFNFLYGMNYGKIFGFTAVLSDITKSVLPFVIVAAFINRHYIIAASTALVFAALVALSLNSAIGFTAKMRLASENKVLSKNNQVGEWQDQLQRKKAKLAGLPPVATTSRAITHDLQAMTFKKRWRSSKQCTEATAKKSRAFCQDYEALKQQREEARAAEILEQDIKTLGNKIASSGIGKVTKTGDAGIALLANFFNIKTGQVKTFFIVLFSLIIEAISTLGFYWFGNHYETSKNSKPKKKPANQNRRKPSRLKSLLKPRQTGSVMAFALESMIYTRGQKVASTGVYAAYKKWCNKKDLKAVPAKTFKTEFAKLGQEIGWQQDNQKSGEVVWLDLGYKQAA